MFRAYGLAVLLVSTLFITAPASALVWTLSTDFSPRASYAQLDDGTGTVTVTFEAFRSTDPENDVSSAGAPNSQVVNTLGGTTGIGCRGGGEFTDDCDDYDFGSNLVDSLRITFSESVVIDEVTYPAFEDDDDVDLYYWTGALWSLEWQDPCVLASGCGAEEIFTTGATNSSSIWLMVAPEYNSPGGNEWSLTSFQASTVPEPGSAILVFGGLISLTAARRGRQAGRVHRTG